MIFTGTALIWFCFPISKVSNMCMFLTLSICEEFTTIRDRALKPPETSEELMDMVKFTQEARTSGMVKLNERIKESKDRLAYLIDVYMFPAEDIELNCEVLTWPNRISPVFDDNDEVCISVIGDPHLYLSFAMLNLFIFCHKLDYFESRNSIQRNCFLGFFFIII